MIRPETLHVSPREHGDATGDVWLHFDMKLLVELSPELARSLVYELAEQVGIFACDRSTTVEGQ